MNKTYQLKTINAQGQIRTQTLEAGLDKAPLPVPSTPGDRHLLLDVQQGSAPDNIRVQRVGKQLRVLFDGSRQADVVLDNFYSDNQADTPATLAGATDQGSTHEYVPETGRAQDRLAQLTDSASPQGMALGGEPLALVEAGAAVGLLAPVAAGGLGLGAVGAGVLGAAALAGGGGSGSGSNGGPPVDPNSKLQPHIAQMSLDSQTDGDWITADTTPMFSGQFGNNLAWSSNGDRFRFQIFKKSGELLVEHDETAIASDHASWSATAPALADGTYLARTLITDASGHVLSQDQQAFVIDHTAPSCVAPRDVHVALEAISGGYAVRSLALSSDEAIRYSIQDGSGNLIAQGSYDGTATGNLANVPRINGSFAAGQFILTYTDASGNTSKYVNDSTWDFNNIPVTTVTPSSTYQPASDLSSPLGTVGSYSLTGGESLDLSAILVDAKQNSALHNTIDMSDSSAQALQLNLNDVLSMGVQNSFLVDGRIQVLLNGDAQDKVTIEDLAAWKTPSAVTLHGVHYQAYVSTNDLAEVLVQQGMLVA